MRLKLILSCVLCALALGACSKPQQTALATLVPPVTSAGSRAVEANPPLLQAATAVATRAATGATGDTAGGPTATPQPQATVAAMPAPTLEGGTVGETYTTPYPAGVDQLVQLALSDLAARLQIGQAAIAVETVRSVVWPDRGLGCPKAGMAYPQVAVEGLLIRLVVGGQTYEYHSGAGTDPFLCQR
jgi:hypothetical protein